MGHSREEKARSRERIVAATSRKLRESGLDNLSVGEVMKSANLTHGGFYGHFASRDAMIIAGLERALNDGEVAATAGERGKARRTVKSILNGYLSPIHRDNPAAGCAVAAVAGDVARADPAIRNVMAGRIDRYIQDMRTAVGDGPGAEDFANAAWATMVGAVVLARVFEGHPRSDQILASARRTILTMEAEGKAGTQDPSAG